MSGTTYQKILAARRSSDFVGREAETERLVKHACSLGKQHGILLLATPGAGATELLRQTYDRLFHEQRETIPFYFAVRRNLASAGQLASDFLNEFIRQLVAFRRQDAAIVRSSVGLDELSELSRSVSGIWIERLIDAAKSLGDGRAHLRTCLSAPIRAAANGDRAVVMIDDAHHFMSIRDGDAAFGELKDILENAGVNFIVSGHRRFLNGQLDCGRLELDNLDFDSAGLVVKVFAEENDIALTESSRDLIATQLDGNASLSRLLVRGAADSGLGLASFEDVEKAYADAIFGGRIARRFQEMFSSACDSPQIEQDVLSLLFDIQSTKSGRLDRALWQRRMNLTATETDALLDRLNMSELIRVSANSVDAVTDNIALTDYIGARVGLMKAPSRAGVFGDALTGYIKRATEIMARSYRAASSLGMRELLGAFDGRRVPTILLDYGEFRDEFKAASDAEVLDAARGSSTVALPRIFFTTSATSFYKPLSQIAESERSAIALGFEASDADAHNEVVWIAAEIDSKVEASRELVEFWCDRLEAAAMLCDFVRFKIWLVAPEGFSPGALEVLKGRNAFGSSRRQALLLGRLMEAPLPASTELGRNEYEIVVPMDADAELVAAHAVEEIARRHNLDSRSINQIKTALIEACINASEHSLSPDRKIYQRFRIDDDRIVLTVSNRGLRLTSQRPAIEPDEGRRGWGLKLMRKLMDEVMIEEVDDGTRIVMTKYLKAA